MEIENGKYVYYNMGKLRQFYNQFKSSHSYPEIFREVANNYESPKIRLIFGAEQQMFFPETCITIYDTPDENYGHEQFLGMSDNVKFMNDEVGNITAYGQLIAIIFANENSFDARNDTLTALQHNTVTTAEDFFQNHRPVELVCA